MLKKLQKWHNRRNLHCQNYAFLFDEAHEAHNDELVCFDCETTHLNRKKAEILSIGAVKIRKNMILTSQKLELLIKPQRKISEESIKIHQLRYCDLERALEAEEAILCFLNFIGSRPLVGYYLEFDVAMINKYLKSLLGIKLPNQQIEVSGLYYDYKQNIFNPIPINLRFDAILKDLDLPAFGQHDALNDALMTAMMYIKLRNLTHP